MIDQTQAICDTANKLGKKSYKSPRILSRERLEAVATGCTPSPPGKANLGSCSSGPINS